MEDTGKPPASPKAVAGPQLHEVAQLAWLDHAPDIAAGALVYLDAGAAEFVHTTLGAPFLLGLGALNVCDLEGASGQDAYLAVLSGQTITTLVFAGTKLLNDLHPHILTAVLAHPTVSKVLVLSSLTEYAHACYGSEDLGVEAYMEYASMLQTDIQDGRMGTGAAENVTVVVKHLPMNMCLLDEHAFVLPARSAAAVQARAGGAAAGWQASDTAQDEGISEAAGGLTLLAHALASLASQLGGKLETHALGPVSLQLAREVASLPAASSSREGSHGGPNTPGSKPQSLGLILIDRSLDLVTPSSHPDHILDLVMSASPRQILPPPPRKPQKRVTTVDWRPVDACVEVPGVHGLAQLASQQPPVGGSDTPAVSDQGHPAPLLCGEVLQPWDKVAMSRVRELMTKNKKEGATAARRWLKQAMSNENVAPSQRFKAGTVTAAELSSLVQDLTTHCPGAVMHHLSAVVLGCAAARALGNDVGDVGLRWDTAASLEKQMVDMLMQKGEDFLDKGSAVCSALQDALVRAQQDEAPLLPTDVLAVLPALYSVSLDAWGEEGRPPASPFSPEDQANLRGSMVEALHHQINVAKASVAPSSATSQAGKAAAQGLSEVWPHWNTMTDTDLGNAVDAMLQRLQYIAQARASLSDDLRHVTVRDYFEEQVGQPNPLVRNLTRRMLQGQELPDLRVITPESLGGLLSKGLSRMAGGIFSAVAGNSAGRQQTRLRDCTTLLIFIVGGVSLAEARLVRQEAELHKDIRVLVSGTALLSPGDVVAQLSAR